MREIIAGGKLMLLSLLIMLLGSCAAQKEVVYIQDTASQQQQNVGRPYQVKITKDDLLAIFVTSKDPELAAPFNMPVVSVQISGQTVGQQRSIGYLVNEQGEIDFPILGRIKVAGMTSLQLTEYIKNRLVQDDIIRDPVVTVQFLNYKVSVLGEVSRPGSFDMKSNRMTILEALSFAGDLTIYGRRDNVTVIREEDGVTTTYKVDLRSSDIFKSPVYYLQQNDVVYVEPNKVRSGQSKINQNNSASVWLSTLNILATIASILILAL